uniref:Kinase n=1 Tax=Scylla olivacea TaxID=85551 RepID=A0A0P4W9T9_SCYOL
MTLGTMNHDADKEDLIQLEPLVHQVSGHSSMFVLDDVTVCKPLIGREYMFYRTLPPEMKQYTPEFHGTLRVVLQEAQDGLTLAALPNKQIPAPRNTQGPQQHGRCLRQVCSGSVELESEGEEESPCSPQDSTSLSSRASTTTTTTALAPLPPDSHNPWLQQCHQTTLHKLKQKSDSSNVVECIMLENLTHKFRYPCVLDLKMGTRQYGDDAPESKRKSQTAKAANTTTITLGVRLAGMQVYNKEEKGYHCKNKYYGQQLSEEGFKETLLHYLHNGHGLRLDIADMIISRLEELSSIISKLDSVRFFTSSLLILYDGFDPSGSNFNQPDCKTERKREPSEHTRLSHWPDQQGEGSSLPQDKWSPKDSRIPPIKMTHPAYIHEMPSPGGGKAREQVSRCESDAPCKSKGWQRNRNHRPPIDIRLIDFAHATHKGMGDSKLYSGPDEGILLGLNSLIKIFTDIRDRYKH